MTKLFNFFFFLFVGLKLFAFELKPFSTYEIHREQFNKAIAELTEFSVEKISWPLQADQNLSTEVAIVKNKKVKPNRIMVISSGIHGVEAYVGSSIQLAFINNYLKQPNEKLDFAFVHVLNPWGMKNNRRVNVDNVDLNRNFLAEANDFDRKNESYEKIEGFLNPKAKIDLHFAQKFMFVLDSMYYIFKFSLESLRQAILQGQYQFPKGIYFGGSHHDSLKNHIDDFVAKKLGLYEEIVWVDLHTGYGERGRLHLLANSADDENSKRIQELFPNHKIDFGQNQNFYKTTGDMISYLSNKSTNFTGVVFEYGTMDSQKPFGSIESLRRMIIENQSFQNGRTDENRTAAENLILEMYNPREAAWWQKITPQTKELFDLLIK